MRGFRWQSDCWEWSVLCEDGGDGLVRLDRAVVLLETATAQRLAHHAVGFGEAQPDAALLEGFMQLGEELDAGHVDHGHGAQEEDGEFDFVLRAASSSKKRSCTCSALK